MKKLCLFLIVILTFSCSSRHENKGTNTETKTVESSTPDFNVALKFINDYTTLCGKSTGLDSQSDWIAKNSLLTANFKEKYKSLLDSANNEDPELGLESDPIFDAQDFPDSGFKILNSDNNTGFVTVKGNGEDSYTVVLKIVLINDKWLVDGAGIINIPADKQAER